MYVYYELDSENKVIHAMESLDEPDISGTDWVLASGKNSMVEILGLTYDSETNTFE